MEFSDYFVRWKPVRWRGSTVRRWCDRHKRWITMLVYRELLDSLYMDGQVRAGADAVGAALQLSLTDEEIAAALEELRQLGAITESDGMLRNGHVDREMAYRERIRTVRSHAGSKGGSLPQLRDVQRSLLEQGSEPVSTTPAETKKQLPSKIRRRGEERRGETTLLGDSAPASASAVSEHDIAAWCAAAWQKKTKHPCKATGGVAERVRRALRAGFSTAQIKLAVLAALYGKDGWYREQPGSAGLVRLLSRGHPSPERGFNGKDHLTDMLAVPHRLHRSVWEYITAEGLAEEARALGWT